MEQKIHCLAMELPLSNDVQDGVLGRKHPKSDFIATRDSLGGSSGPRRNNARVDEQTAQMIHHLKIATGVEVTRLICFSIRHLFEQFPELKIIIKDHLEKFEL